MRIIAESLKHNDGTTTCMIQTTSLLQFELLTLIT